MWRDGQARRVYVYRLLATGALDEKIWQRQCSKEGLKCVVDGAAGAAAPDAAPVSDLGAGGGGADSALLSVEELRDLFTLRDATPSDTLDALLAAEDEGRLDGGGVGAAGGGVIYAVAGVAGVFVTGGALRLATTAAILASVPGTAPR